MSRNVDIVALVLLLLGIAVYSHVRRFINFEIESHKIAFTHNSRMIVIPPHVPQPPPLPHIKVMRD